MPSPSVSYSFSNSTTADASQVNQNFTDLINSCSDGTKDFSISALTCAGAVTLNGNTTIGNASSDTLTVTASLASHLNPSAHNTYDLGTVTTLGFRAIFMASSSATKTAKILGPAISSDIILTLPDRTGTIDVVKDKSYEITNLTIAASVASSALTIAIKDKSGSDASTSSPIFVGFRSATAATGTYSQVSITGALSTVISSGSTAGHVSGVAKYLYVYLINNSGTAEVAWSSTLFDDGSIVTTTAEGGAGAADSSRLIYSTTARTGVACRLIGRMLSNQATAGTWASTMSEISLQPFDPGMLFSHYTITSGPTYSSGVEYTVVWQSKLLDTTGANMNTSTGVYTFTRTGLWRVKAFILGIGPVNSSPHEMKIRLNLSGGGLTEKRYSQNGCPGNASSYNTIHIDGIFSVTTGDTCDITYKQTQGSDFTLSTTGTYHGFDAQWIGLP